MHLIPVQLIIGKHTAIQTIFKIPDDKKDLLPELIKVDAKDIPDLNITGGSAKLLVGHLGQKGKGNKFFFLTTR